jgi:hypothetical protein
MATATATATARASDVFLTVAVIVGNLVYTALVIALFRVGK